MVLDQEVSARLPEHVRALLVPSTYQHPVQDIKLIQTHISWVVLAGDHAYKLKKPVNLGFLDFTSLEARKRYCTEEVRLNSRTCATLYYGVVSISHDGQRFRVGGPGEVLDYAVHMRRLPPARVLANLLDAGAVTHAMLGRLVWKIARFHASAARGKRVREAGGYATMVANWASNLAEIAPFIGRTLTSSQFDAIHSYADAFLAEERDLLLSREREGRVRDGHGDLRADAIAFDGGSPDGVCIFDCLEFDERLRCADTGLDIAFLAMDLHRRGYPEFEDVVLSLYSAAAADKTLALVSGLFRAYRAVIRGKVAGILMDQEGVGLEQRRAAEAESRHHFELAASYRRANSPPRLLLVMGLSGSGKSLLAGALAHRIGAVLLSTDILRKEIAGEPPGRGRPVAVDSERYSPENRARVYDQMTRQAEEFLSEGRAVVLDGTYLEAAQRAPILALARRAGVPLLVVECHAPDDVIKARQEGRESEPWTPSEATWEVYLAQKARYEPPDDVPPAWRLSIDTSTGLLREIEAVLERLR
ncbi:MAG TPA: AAA family ATPase [Dehalococcoidia bacterium]|nr:AAA family ATPase [Dehalococcoidia bacterium]